ncbi:unnamed protein product [Penicillium nalgiovense]|uniref:AA1-like domain-containing protein n=1 Tax=Penicillium nalgiovense TaxID=60175 RepID=A0A1V6YC04_PENNA|nr:hypothetical protein PENNAL_c0025G05772 [Penicillium nalgiovense]CAG7937797.1 unnamed protein product [Penicillium nalgiovense]CAG7950623.1 unnamed protein product [Penicillium nalgiovense]CAG7988776.1 unnamed protein product [Penicillium nalgiovense]CAG7990841.1 unnamed protein product [Penicillium nalgiovense]
MKTSFVPTVLSLAGAAFAAPAPESRFYPYSIGDLSLKHTIEGDTWDMKFYLTSRSPMSEALETTVCHTGWTNGTLPVGPKSPEPCADPAYSFFFPAGASDVEKYEIAAEGPAGTAVNVIESGYKYQCGPYTGPVGNVDMECKTINGGEFYLHQ